MNSKQDDNPTNKETVFRLLTRYNTSTATPEDIEAIERYVEKGLIDLDDLDEIRGLENRLQRFEYPPPSSDLDVAFYNLLAREKKAGSQFSLRNWFNNAVSAPRLAFAAVTFILGLVVGYSLYKPATGKNDIQKLTTEVNTLKEMMMLSLLEKESATDRLKAVNLTQEMGSASNAVTKALLATLNNDGNVNVRLAALEALIPYTKDSAIRKELIRSIATQESPLVQVALADLMVALQEKSSVKEFEKLFDSVRMPDEIEERIRERISVMI